MEAGAGISHQGQKGVKSKSAESAQNELTGLFRCRRGARVRIGVTCLMIVLVCLIVHKAARQICGGEGGWRGPHRAQQERFFLKYSLKEIFKLLPLFISVLAGCLFIAPVFVVLVFVVLFFIVLLFVVSSVLAYFVILSPVLFCFCFCLSCSCFSCPC